MYPQNICPWPSSGLNQKRVTARVLGNRTNRTFVHPSEFLFLKIKIVMGKREKWFRRKVQKYFWVVRRNSAHQNYFRQWRSDKFGEMETGKTTVSSSPIVGPVRMLAYTAGEGGRNVLEKIFL